MTSRADDELAIPARVLSSTQLALLAERGEELTAEVGEKLYEIGHVGENVRRSSNAVHP